ncbi:MAG: hypothetical protein EZS28_032751 [Streblomastix strix]|uniref:Uncharacterized protein n=1 Tax=Streblomastix strix TaxID=222440 RepID=A0A5J4UN55_9EUKA|nr:MAG: hypothetical protein EZS28_032751 [Streblomastix strix]
MITNVKYQGVKSSWPTPEPSKIWKGYEDEDTVEALSYSAATSKAILEIIDEIAKYDKRIIKKHKKKFM